MTVYKIKHRDEFDFRLVTWYEFRTPNINLPTFPPVEDKLSAVPLPKEQLSQHLSDSEPEEIPDW
jgi:hypothetical protein